MNINTSYSAASAGTIQSGASAPMSPTQKMSDLFDAIDTTGSGAITKAQFTQAFQTMAPPASFKSAGVDAIWAKLDPNGTGSVSKQDFTTDMVETMKQLRGHHHHGHQASAAGAKTLTQTADQLAALGTPSSLSNGGAAPGSTDAGAILDLLA